MDSGDNFTVVKRNVKPMKVRAVEHRPTYFDDSALLLQPEEKQGELYGMRAKGWCMWPNVWDGDFLICRGVPRLSIEKTRDYDTQPLAGPELFCWRQFERRMVHFEFNGEQMLKRLLINMASRRPQLSFHADNAREYMGPTVTSDYKDEVRLLGVVEMIVPIDRTLQALPKSLRSEYERVYAPEVLA